MESKRRQSGPAGQGRTMFVLLIWPEHQSAEALHWRGVLESAEGERYYFRCLDELNRLVIDRGGWRECRPDPQGDNDHEPIL